MPSPVNPPSGCHFHTRCWLRERLGNPERCVSEVPVLRETSTGHEVACHFPEEVEGSKEQRQSTGRDASGKLLDSSMGAPADAAGTGHATAPAAVVADGAAGTAKPATPPIAPSPPPGA